MTLDKTLQKIIQRAEIKDADVILHSDAVKVHARLLPIIKGLCEEVERLRLALENIKVHDQEVDNGKIVYANCGEFARQALSTSALEKLGGGDE
ncbi:MAG: hypothetical protein ACRCST_00735 [Turicibacter sp.]